MKQFLLLLCCLNSFVFTSAQNSKIKVYFNKTVNTTYSSLANANYTPAMEDTIIAYINKANTSLDIAMYNNNSSSITTAINNAYSRGVIVRYISTSITSNTALANLNSNIPVLKRNSNDIMHNKFVIIDVGNSSNAQIITGSVNFTYEGIYEDYNNLVIIQDQALAQAYTTEFQEMWGSATANYNVTNAKFGSQKTNNTPHTFNINGTTVELYFSPSDATTSHINTAIATCNSDLKIGAFIFIDNSLGTTTRNLHTGGKDVKAIVENASYTGSEYNFLFSNGVDIWSHESVPYLFHHKYAIVDATNVSSDPLVVTGSHNWTSAAETVNDENTLIIHDAYIANEFYEEFLTQYHELNPVSIIQISNDEFIKVYPNPTTSVLYWENPISINIESVVLYNLYGQKVLESTIPNKIDIGHLSNGIYIVQFFDGVQYYNTKVIKM